MSSPQKDSISPRFDKLCCCFTNSLCSIFFCTFYILFFFAIYKLIKYFVDLSHSGPHIYVQDLYVPALDKTTTFNTSNNSVYIDLLFARRAAAKRLSYKDFQLTLSFGMNSSRVSPVGISMIHGFSMGRKKRVIVKAEVGALRLPWEEAVRVVSNDRVVFFAVKLAVNRRSDDPAEAVADVMVDASGHMFSKDPIKFEEVIITY